MRRTSHRIIATAVAGALVLLVTGCGGDADKGTAPAAPQASTTSDGAREDGPTPPAKGTHDPTLAPIERIAAASQEHLGELKKSTNDTFSDIQITAEGDSTLLHRYVFDQSIDADTARKSAKASTRAAEQSIEEDLLPAMKRAGVVSPTVRYVYEDASGAILWEQTFPPLQTSSTSPSPTP